MPRRPSPETPQIVDRSFSAEEIDRGIEKLRIRIAEVESLDPQKIAYDDASVKTAQHNIRDSVREIFGGQSQEARDFMHPSIYASEHRMYGFGESPNYQGHFAKGITQTVISLKGLIARLEEKRIDIGVDPVARARTVFEGMDLHARIATVCVDLYRDGHYPQAVFDASKALVNFVKERSAKYDLDGTKLMTTVFSKNNPILAFNDLKDQSDLDEQEGMMYLFMGAVLGVRNPRGHSFLTDSPQDALEYIGLLSLLANRVDKAKRRP